MGIQGFFQAVRDKAPDAIELLDDTVSWRGRRLGIDAPVLLFRARAATSSPWAYLSYIVEHLAWARGLGILPLFVFDGQKPFEKRDEDLRRQAHRAHQEEERKLWETRLARAEEWDTIEACRMKIERHARASVVIGREEKVWVQRLLDSCGLPWCTAPTEAEAFLTALQLAGYIDDIVTEDSDAIICGASSIVRNFWGLRAAEAASILSPALFPQRIHTVAILRAMHVDASGLRVAAVLAGCDFAPKLKNVGFRRALHAVNTYQADLPACLRLLKHADVASSPRKLQEYTTAVGLLSPPPLGEGDLQRIPLPQQLPPCPEQMGEIVKEAELSGEPWALRAAFTLLAPGPLRPLAAPLIPQEWLQGGTGDGYSDMASCNLALLCPSTRYSFETEWGQPDARKSYQS